MEDNLNKMYDSYATKYDNQTSLSSSSSSTPSSSIWYSWQLLDDDKDLPSSSSQIMRQELYIFNEINHQYLFVEYPDMSKFDILDLMEETKYDIFYFICYG